MAVQKSTSAPVAVKASKLPAASEGASLLERFKDFPAIDVITRRFANPNDPGSLPILLRDESPDACINSEHQNRLKARATKCHLCSHPARKWFLYWVNTGQEGRWGRIKSEGYVPVEVKDLQDAQDVSDLVRQTEDGGSVYVRRGDRGGEILMKQPLELYLEIKRRQRALRDARAKSAKARRDERAEAIGRELGDEAGQAVHDGGIQEEFMHSSKTTLGEEAGLDE